MEIKYKIWVEKDGKVLFGRGRDDILKAIDKERSLNAATLALGMSYRAAWGRIRASEERLGLKLVENEKNTRMMLTQQARDIINRFEALEKEIDQLLKKANHDFQKYMDVSEKKSK